MMNPDSRIAMRSGKEVKIGLVKNSATKTVKYGGGNMYQQNKKARAKLIQLTQVEGYKNGASYMKAVDKFITECGGTS